ncbi:MAG: DUF1549 domain-containing protein, partial [Planctomyces sp.]
MSLNSDSCRLRTQTALSGSVGILRRLMMTGFVVVLTVSSCSLNEVRAEDQPHPDPSVAEVRFGRDILPILSDSCFSCHGPDEAHRKGDLRLDTPEGAASVLGDGNAAESELLRRITSTDPELVMPPADSGRKPLTEQQQLLLRRWIESGASWGKHWAFESPVKVEVPRSQEAGWDHPVDAFIHEKLEEIGLTASPSAAAHTVARRMAFDITGLPPSSEMLSEFLADAKQNPDEAAGRLADRLLQSPHYGERMAMWWLDAARYADTDGFQGDATRTNWPWRDWVVDAFNSGMPYDQFTIEQFAGDLLPDATVAQKIATCFHRNHMTNGEGGRDPEESRIDYVIDRVSSTGTVWLGLTLGCCQCHSHKFDPVSQHEFYSLSAFFNSIDESGKAGREAKPYQSWSSPHVAAAAEDAETLLEIRNRRLDQARKDAEPVFQNWLKANIDRIQQDADSLRPWNPLPVSELETTEGTVLTLRDDGTIAASGPDPRQDDYRIVGRPTLERITGIRLDVLPHPSHTAESYSRGRGGHFVLTDIKVQVRRIGSSQVQDIAVRSAIADLSDDTKKYDGYGNIQHVLDDDPRNGWSTRDGDPKVPRTAVFAFTRPLTLASDELLVFEMRHRSTVGDANIGLFRVSVTDQNGPVLQSL